VKPQFLRLARITGMLSINLYRRTVLPGSCWKTVRVPAHHPRDLAEGPSDAWGIGCRLDKALFDMAPVMYPQLQTVDFRRDVPALSVPVYLVQGAHELRGRLEPARQWFDALTAPHKEWIAFEQSGHIPQFDEFARFRQLLTGTIVPRTYR
jgi:pimeloyl-ACP methyl ester carboxylesterase